MKCKVCNRAMVQLFMSWACDYCDGKSAPKQTSGMEYARVPYWLALFGSDGKEVSGPGYQRVRVSPGWNQAFTGDAKFPSATGDWGVVCFAGLMDAEQGGNILTQIHFQITRQIGSGDTLSVRCGT
jgi:hypothetical protein